MYQFLVIAYFCTFKLLLNKTVVSRESVVLDREYATRQNATDCMGSQHILTGRCVCLVQDSIKKHE